MRIVAIALTLAASGMFFGSLGAAGLHGGLVLTPAARRSVTPRGSGQGNGGLEPLPGAVEVHLPPRCTSYKSYGVPMVEKLRKGKTYDAVIVTNKGSIIVQLLPDLAPITVQSFIFLAQHHYFDGVRFHRVVPHFIIQAGDPTGTGYCGPGYIFRNEPVQRPYVRGALAMANAGLDTNGSQFFIVLKNDTILNREPNYTIFGQVIHGLSAVDRIASVPLGLSPLGERSAPTVKVYMSTVRIVIK